MSVPRFIRKRLAPIVEELEPRRLLSLSVATIAAQNVPAGKSLLVPVSGADDVPVDYQVSSDNPNVTATVLSGNSFMEMDVAGYGTMVFELFNNFAPQTVAQISGLVNSGFYNGLTFWRVLSGFVAQAGGSPTGDGNYPSSGTVPEIVNEPDLNAIFSGDGQLAMANAGTNTNTEQFFITDGTQRELDYLYTLFGQLVEGQSVFSSIMSAPVESQPLGSSTEDSKPLTPIVITSATIVQDTSDAVILITDPGGVDSANITLTASDGDGGDSQQTFAVSGVDDSANNDPPFITSLDTSPATPENVPVTLDVGALDADGDAVQVLTSQSPTGVSLQVSGSSVVATPDSGFTGSVQFEIAVTDSAHLTDAENGQAYVDLITLDVQAQPAGVVSGSTLFVNGTTGPDTIIVDFDSGDYAVSVNGVLQQIDGTGVTSVVVNGLDGDDAITLGRGMTSGASVQGGPGDDTIQGGPGDDTLGGGQGNDSILGDAGDDSLKGGLGDDTLAGGKGNDTLFGSLGNDLLRGGLGDDYINGGAGANQMYGGQGNNTFYAASGTGDQVFAGAATNDFLDYSVADSPIIETGIIPAQNQTIIS